MSWQQRQQDQAAARGMNAVVPLVNVCLFEAPLPEPVACSLSLSHQTSNDERVAAIVHLGLLTKSECCLSPFFLCLSVVLVDGGLLTKSECSSYFISVSLLSLLMVGC